MLRLDIQLFADGKVVIETDLDTKGMSAGLSKIKSIASKGFKAVATATSVAAGAVAGLVGASVKAAGELEQQIGGAEAVFGKLGKTIDSIKFKSFKDGEGQLMSLSQVANQAYSTMGLSANDFMGTLNKMGALMQGSGLSTQKSLDLSAQAMQRAADVASIMGIDVQDAMTAIAGAAKGNFTMMDNLGVAMNATNIEAYALSKGIKKAYNEMSQAEKVGLAMEMFLEKSSYAAGNYAKENETFAGSFSTLKAATQNFLSGAGGIEELTNALVSFGSILAKSIGEMAPKVLEGIVNLVDNVIPEIPKLLEQILPTIIEGATNLINGLVVIFPKIVTLIQQNLPIIVNGAITIVKTLITTILGMLPDILKLGMDLLSELKKGIAKEMPTLIPMAIETILTLVETLLDNIDSIIDTGIEMMMALIDGIMNSIPILLEKVPEIITKLIEALITNLPKLMTIGPQLILKLISGIVKSLPSLVAMAPKLILALVNGILNSLGKLGTTGAEIIKKIKESLKELPNKAKEWGKDMISGFVKGITGNINKVKEGVSNVAEKVKNFLHFSKPDEGPLREYETWMPDMIDGLVKTLKKSSPKLIDEFKNITGNMNFDMDGIFDDMQKAVDTETAKMSANVQTNGTYQMAMAGTPEFNLLDNTENTTQLVCDGKVLAEIVNTQNKYREVAKA